MMKQETVFKVCVDELYASSISGRLYSELEEHPFAFYDFQQLLLHMDHLLDLAGRPQSSHIKKSFTQQETNFGYRFHPQKQISDDAFKDKQGNIGTFSISILSRHNAAIQGICILNEQKTFMFNSELELLHLFENITNHSLLTSEQK